MEYRILFYSFRNQFMYSNNERKRKWPHHRMNQKSRGFDYKMSKHTFDFNEKLAKVMMANSADASEEEALWALQESGESGCERRHCSLGRQKAKGKENYSN
jgi:hypothetical protein